MNKNKNSKIMLVLSILLLLFLVMSSASAADDKISNETVLTSNNDVNTLNTVVSVDDGASNTDDTNNIIGTSDASNKTGEHTLKASNTDNFLKESESYDFDGLNQLIISTPIGEELKLANDFNGTKDLTLSKSFTLNGNGKILNFNNHKLTITGNNVILNNLTIVNATEIIWEGDYGEITNTIMNNTGAIKDKVNFISWIGQNGKFNGNTITGGFFGTTYDWNVMHIFGTVDMYNSTFENITAVNCAMVYHYYTTGYMYNITFKNIKAQYNGMTGILKPYMAILDIVNCTFSNITRYSSNQITDIICLSDSSCYVYNSTFENFDQFIKIINACQANIYNSTFIKGNCVNTDNNNIAYNLVGNHFVNFTSSIFVNRPSTFDGNTFEGFKNTVLDIKSSNVLVNNSNFIDNKAENLILISKDYVTLTNSEFINNNRTYDVKVNNNLKVNMANNGDINISGENITSFTLYNKIFVSPNGDDNGLTNITPTDLLTGLNLCSDGGTLYLLKGTYTALTNKYDCAFNIIGYEPGVIIENGTFSLKSSGLTVKNIYFKNMQDCLRIYDKTTVENCNFTSKKDTHIIYFTSTANLEAKFKDIYVINTTINSNIFGYEYNRINPSTITNFNIVNSTINDFIRASQIGSLEINYLNLKNTTVNGNLLYTNFLKASASEFFQLQHLTLNHVNITNSTFKDDIVKIDDYYRLSQFIISDFNVTNSTLSGSVYKSQGKSSLKDFKISDLTNKTSVEITVLDFVQLGEVSNVIFENFNAKSLFKSTSGTGIKDFTINKVTSNDGLDTVGYLNNINVKDSNFTDNVISLNDDSKLTGSVFDHYQGNIIVMGDNVDISNCTFKFGNNSESNGSIVVVGDYLTIEKCSFINNTALNGGAIFLVNTTNTSSILDSDFINNTAKNLGGAMYVNPGMFYYIADDNTFTNNNDSKNLAGKKYNSKDIYENGALESISIIYVSLDDGQTQNSGATPEYPTTFEVAFASIAPGGTIIFVKANESKTFDGKYDYSNPIRVVKKDLTFIGNNTSVSNITFKVSNRASGLNISNFIFKDNPDTVFIWEGINGILNNCTFINNGGKTLTDGSVTGHSGAAIQVKAENLTINNTRFINNKASNSTSTSPVTGGAIYVDSFDLTIDNCNFTGNTARDSANHIYISSNSYNINLTNSRFENTVLSSSGSIGSAIVVYGINVNVINGTFSNNKAVNGGALYINTVGKVSVISSNFSDNTASGNGGALYIAKGNVSIISSNFSSNGAVNGGAIYSSVPLSLVDSNFTRNTAFGNGGAVYLNGKNNLLSNLNFIGNTAVNGSAIYLVDNGGVEFRNVLVKDNIVDSMGAGDVYIGDDASFTIPNDDLKLDSSSKQTIRLGSFTSPVIYVNSDNPGEFGTGTYNDPVDSIADGIVHVENGGRIILLSDTELTQMITIMGKTFTLVGNASTVKRDENNNNKSLFIPRITPKLLSMKKVKKVLLIQIIFYHFPSCKNPPFYEFAQQ